MRGVDIHPVYQEGVRWPVLGGTDCEFVWVKVSDGMAAYRVRRNGKWYDSRSHIDGAKSQNMKVGGYHYAQFGDPEQQADILCREVKRWGALSLPPALDIEDPFSANETARVFAKKFCERVAHNGLRPAVYMNSSMASVLKPHLWGIKGLVIWIADYGANNGRRNPNLYPYMGRVDVHQYTSKGSIAGIPGDVDLNYPYNTTFMQGTPPASLPTTKEDEMSAKVERQVDELHAMWRAGKTKVQTPGVLTKYLVEMLKSQRAQSAQIATLIKMVSSRSDLTEDQVRTAMRTELDQAGISDVDEMLEQLQADLDADGVVDNTDETAKPV